MTKREIEDAVRREVEPMTAAEAKTKIIECRNSAAFMQKRESFSDPAGDSARALWTELHKKAYPEPPIP
jgi:hypothetical protein